MKNRTRNILLVTMGVVILVLLIVVFRGSSGTMTGFEEIDTVVVRNSGSTLVVGRNGGVELTSTQGIFTDRWTSGKISAFFSYLEENYSGSAVFNESTAKFAGLDGDELVFIVGQEVSGASGPGGGGATETGGSPGGASGGSGGGGSGSSAGSGDGGSDGSSGSGTSGGGGGSECLFWRLSYCVILHTPAPSATPTSGPGILPADCGENLETGRTVIGNELCLPTPTPSPTP